MSLLLDTHILLWAAYDDSSLPAAARARISDPNEELWFSAVSLWEVAIKRGLNRPDFTVEPSVLRAGLLTNGYKELALDGRHCLTLMALPMLHRDPFDRMLIAQAATEGIVLLTADSQVSKYPGPIELV